jgi:hypothetical protein
MTDISVTSVPTDNGWTFGVQVAEQNGQTRHSVTLSRQDFEALTAGKSTTPEQLVRRSFEFLLEREPKHQILRQFDLPAIVRYFPEYPAEIVKKL